jgi:hypothetical protein
LTETASEHIEQSNREVERYRCDSKQCRDDQRDHIAMLPSQDIGKGLN